MFENPEKLFIIMMIALFIFGPQKLIGLGSAMGRAVRDFRSAVRDAHDQFSAAVEEAQRTEESYLSPPALPAPDPMPEIPVSADPAPAAGVVEAVPAWAPEAPASGVPVAPAADAADAAAEHEGPQSLASEPSSQAVLEVLQESLQRKV
jgi:TatA/E family protein of Tat protein translocase